MQSIKEIPRFLAIGLVRFYQLAISPLFPPSCRFTPTCSEYMLCAIRRFGFLKGLFLGVKRILKCHPGGPYGYDPVPEKTKQDNLKG